ncbi:MAG: hypothetical protein GY772_30345 [bacterium]|nr:hypothetical protein [bacterium]
MKCVRRHHGRRHVALNANDLSHQLAASSVERGEFGLREIEAVSGRGHRLCSEGRLRGCCIDILGEDILPRQGFAQARGRGLSGIHFGPKAKDF